VEVEDEEEVSSLEGDDLVSFVSQGYVLVRAEPHPVEALLQRIHRLIEALQL